MQRINEKLSVVSEYESGKAIPNQQIIAKMERVLGEALYSILPAPLSLMTLINPPRCSPPRGEGGATQDHGAWQAPLINFIISIKITSTLST